MTLTISICSFKAKDLICVLFLSNLRSMRSRVGSYMQLKELANASVDLVTCCQAIHWFDDIPAFYAEVYRVFESWKG